MDMHDQAGFAGGDSAVVAPVVYTAGEAAAILRCSEWWLSDRARRGVIPFVFIGGQYRFTVEQLVRILALHSVTERGVAPMKPVAPSRAEAPMAPVAHLRARSPRRTRSSADRFESAA